MAQLTRDQIAEYARVGGFTGADVEIAVAVALAESGGDTHAHNTKAPDNSYGLMQINMYGSLGPDRRKRFGLKSNDDLFNPATNMKAAKAIKDGSGWNAWTTFTTGKYKRHIDNDKSLLDNFNDGVGVIREKASMESVANAINAVGENLFKGVANIAAIIVAVVLLAVGVLILARKQVPLAKVKKVVK